MFKQLMNYKKNSQKKICEKNSQTIALLIELDISHR